MTGAPRTSEVDAVRRALSRPPGSPDAHVLVPTSGSTGMPRTVRISGGALRASGEATAARLGGHGRWLLALPTTHVAGLQVLARSVLAGSEPVVLDTGAGFRPASFAAATDALHARGGPAVRLYTSLVPTQLHRLLTAAGELDGELDGEPGTTGVRSEGRLGLEGRAGLEAARRYDAVLVGGAATSPALLAAARSAGICVVTTYGMSETAGGCVYDGVPLEGVGVRIRDGRIEISGPVLADGYVDDPGATRAAFVVDSRGGVDSDSDSTAGTRWFRTSDLGRFERSPAGAARAAGPAGPVGSTGPVGPVGPVLTVLGRADDTLVTGGVNVAPAAVEALLAGWGGLGEVCVVGLPDDEWGTRIVAVVTLATPKQPRPQPRTAGAGPASDGDAALGAGLLPGVRGRVAAVLGAPAAPRDVVVVGSLPVRGPGKPDRRAAAVLAARRLSPGEGQNR